MSRTLTTKQHTTNLTNVGTTAKQKPYAKVFSTLAQKCCRRYVATSTATIHDPQLPQTSWVMICGCWHRNSRVWQPRGFRRAGLNVALGTSACARQQLHRVQWHLLRASAVTLRQKPRDAPPQQLALELHPLPRSAAKEGTEA